MSQAPPSGTSPASPGSAASPLRLLAAIGVGLGFAVGVTLLVRHSELVTGRYVSSGVPPVLAFAAAFLLSVARPLLRRLHPALAMTRPQVLLVYAMLTLVVVLHNPYVVRAFLPHLTSLDYGSMRQPALRRFTEYLPAWWGPGQTGRDPEVVRTYFEGFRPGGVPWEAWVAPLALWFLFFLAIFVATGCLMTLLRHQWIHSERLSFPLLYLPLAVTQEGGPLGAGGLGPIFRQPLMWLGFAVAAGFNGINIAHALWPAVPAPGFVYRFQGMFPDPPWTPLNTVMLFFMLEAIGFGYFLSLEVSFSTWFFYLVMKVAAIACLSGGLDLPGLPFMHEHSAGATLAVALLIGWNARRTLALALRHALLPVKSPEAREAQRAVWGLVASVAFVLGWCQLAGLSWMVALPFVAVLGGFVLVYARIRAETGVPFEFVYPYGQPKELLVSLWSPRGMIETAGLRSWTVFSGLAWLSRHHYAQSMAAYQIDSLKLAEEARIPRRWLWLALGLAFVVGLAGSFWAHLDAYYEIGSNLSGGATGRGEYRATVALQEYQRMAALVGATPSEGRARVMALAIGFAFALLLGLARQRMARSPFHPLGFILATAYGDHSTLVFPMFVAWLCKASILKMGGLRLYRTFVPFFLGLIMGHVLIAGIGWPLFSLLLRPEARQSYHLFLGG